MGEGLLPVGNIPENRQEIIVDTAIVVRAAYSMNFFRDFEVREIIARPRCRVWKLPEYEFENWKGDLEAYYKAEK